MFTLSSYLDLHASTLEKNGRKFDVITLVKPICVDAHCNLQIQESGQYLNRNVQYSTQL